MRRVIAELRRVAVERDALRAEVDRLRGFLQGIADQVKELGT